MIRQISFPLGFVCRPDHPLVQQSAVRLAECAGYPMIIAEKPLALASVFVRLTATANLTPAVAARANNVQMIISLVRTGIGIGFLSYLDVMSEVTDGQLAFVPLVGADIPSLTLALACDRTRHLSRATHLACDAIEDMMTRHAG